MAALLNTDDRMSGLEEQILSPVISAHQIDANMHDEDDKPDLRMWKHYLATRIPTLFNLHSASNLNPLPGLRKMTAKNWLYFFMGFMAWCTASFSFFCVSVAGTDIAKSLGKTAHDITWGLAVVLMVRSVGAVISGYFADNYSRKWPYIANLTIFLVIQLATGYVKNYKVFLVVRMFSGLSMGGIYATASATAIEDAPLEARAFLSGLYFVAYNFGFIFAQAVYHAVTPNWPRLFWISTAWPGFLIVLRLLTPETEYFTKVLKAKALMKLDGHFPKRSFAQKLEVSGFLIKRYWLEFAYLVLLMVGANYLTHGTQDLHPTLLRVQRGYNPEKITVTICIVNIGGIVGGMVIGQLMEIFGRRLSIAFCCILAGACAYPAYMMTNYSAIIGGGFFLYFGVMGVWAVLAIHMAEMAPPNARVLISGLAYQLGNLASSAASTIETDLATDFKPYKPAMNGHPAIPDYGKVMAVLSGAVFIYTLFFVIIGYERYHRDLSSKEMKEYIGLVDAGETPETYQTKVDNGVDRHNLAAALEKASVEHSEKQVV